MPRTRTTKTARAVRFLLPFRGQHPVFRQKAVRRANGKYGARVVDYAIQTVPKLEEFKGSALRHARLNERAAAFLRAVAGQPEAKKLGWVKKLQQTYGGNVDNAIRKNPELTGFTGLLGRRNAVTRLQPKERDAVIAHAHKTNNAFATAAYFTGQGIRLHEDDVRTLLAAEGVQLERARSRPSKLPPDQQAIVDALLAAKGRPREEVLRVRAALEAKYGERVGYAISYRGKSHGIAFAKRTRRESQPRKRRPNALTIEERRAIAAANSAKIRAACTKVLAGVHRLDELDGRAVQIAERVAEELAYEDPAKITPGRIYMIAYRKMIDLGRAEKFLEKRRKGGRRRREASLDQPGKTGQPLGEQVEQVARSSAFGEVSPERIRELVKAGGLNEKQETVLADWMNGVSPYRTAARLTRTASRVYWIRRKIKARLEHVLAKERA